ncbi:MAG: phosphatidate cytidylyltransferase, partial [Gammaproteobacteria bacterium]
GIYNISYLPLVFSLTYLLFVIRILFIFPIEKISIPLLEITIIFLVMTSLSSILYLHQQPLGVELCLTVVFLTNLSDVFALLGGATLGKKHLLPQISPNKTIAGVITALVATVGLAFIFNQGLGLGLDGWAVIFFGSIISISAQAGDLVASFAKRQAGIKDFGNLIPGHGGILDRCDSLIFSLPIAILCLVGIGTI